MKKKKKIVIHQKINESEKDFKGEEKKAQKLKRVLIYLLCSVNCGCDNS